MYDGWQNIFMADPTLWALLLAVAELTIAVLLVKSPRAGYVAVIAFHLALMCFGWGFWLWSVPPCASRSRRPATPSGPAGSAHRAQMKMIWAPSVFSMKSAALMMPSTSSERSDSSRCIMSADIRQAQR